MASASTQRAVDPFRFVYRPWAERAATSISTSPEAVAQAVVDFVAGRPFDDIAKATGMPRATVLGLYRMTWMHAVIGDPLQKEAKKWTEEIESPGSPMVVRTMASGVQ